jgi:hypothetical protein
MIRDVYSGSRIQIRNTARKLEKVVDLFQRRNLRHAANNKKCVSDF